MVEFNEESETKVVGIFWDIENCRIPKRTSVEEVVDNVKKSANIGSVDHKLVLFCCSCRRLSDFKTKRLNALKVDILLVSSDRNSADNKLIDKMIDFLDDENYLNKQKVLVLISGDSDFVHFLNSKAKVSPQTEVVVIYWNNCSQQLLNEFNCIRLELRSIKRYHSLKHQSNINKMNDSFDHKLNEQTNCKPRVYVFESEEEDQDMCQNGCNMFADFCCIFCSCVIS